MFDALVDRISAAMWNLRPSEAVLLGKHEYDGVVPDLSEDTVADQLRRLRTLSRQLDSLEGLSADQQIDRIQLRAAVERVVLDHEVLRDRQRNPMAVVNLLDITPYLNRAYAPPSVRALRIVDVLEQAPRVLAQARAVLDPVVPEVLCRWGMRSASGMAEALETELPDELAGLDDPVLRSRLGDAARVGADALRGYAAWIDSARLGVADDAFPIGEGALAGLLLHGELLTTPVAELLEVGEADLAANLEAFRDAAAAVDPTCSAREAYARHVASARPPADGMIATVEGMLEGIRSFVLDERLVTIPSEVRATVAPTPRHLRWAFAMMDTPGPYETEATEAIFYVTPPEADWSPEQVDEWLSALNVFHLEDVSIHEVYPGHYVHFLHANSAPTEVSRRLASYAFSEGWAHYAEQLLWESGYRGGDPRFRLAQLSGALVRNCRFVCSLRMHTGEMSLPEAVDFFRLNTHFDETPARAEAERGAFDPGYFSYTLGKLQILDLRADYRAARGPEFTLREFHDRLLSRGAPPVEVMRAEMLPGR